MPDLFDIIDEGTQVDVVVTTPVIDVGVLPTLVSVVTVEGPAGLRGPAGDNAQIVGETPTGARDGVNAYFTTTHLYQPHSTAVYTNGIRETLGVTYYEPAPGVIEYDEAPTPEDHIGIDYLIA